MTFTDATLKSIKRKDGKNKFNPEITTHCDLTIFTDYESCILISPSVIILYLNGLAHTHYPLRSSYRHNQGWDWIAPCGTTTIASSLEKIKNGNATRSEASGETFVGGLSHREKNGLYVFTLHSGLQANMARTEEQCKKMPVP